MIDYYELPTAMSYKDIGVDPRCQKIRIRLNGEIQLDCTGFDVDEGWVERYKRVDDKFVIDKTGKSAVRERIEGTVVVNWLDEEPN